MFCHRQKGRKKMENKRNIKSLIMGIILFILTSGLAVGVQTVFSACKHKTDAGMWMACHWAQMAVFGTACAMAVIALALIIVKNNKVRLGLAFSLIPMSVYTALIPNTLINLCMKTDMRCHSVMKPAVIVISILIAVVSAVYLIANKNEE